jgi:hypothetical protein
MNIYSQMMDVIAPQPTLRTGTVQSASGGSVVVQTEDAAFEIQAANTIGAGIGDQVVIADGQTQKIADYTYDSQVHYV